MVTGRQLYHGNNQQKKLVSSQMPESTGFRAEERWLAVLDQRGGVEHGGADLGSRLPIDHNLLGLVVESHCLVAGRGKGHRLY